MNRSAHTPVAARLGEFVAGTKRSDIPAAVWHEAKRSLLNFFGCALGAACDPAIDALLRVLAPHSGRPQAALVGRSERLDPLGAAFVNAVAANLFDYDDTHLRTVIHPTAPVAAPALALAELRNSSGAEVVLAVLLGAEVACRLGNAVSPGHYARGWHITTTCGVFGAAAASARLLGLDAARTGHALGIAASQSSGLVENLATAAKNVGVGNAARNGLFAALLAAEGYEAAPAAIEGPLGWARAAGDVPDSEEAVGGLGERWEIAFNTYKPYPSGIVFHSVIDACLELRRRHGLVPDAIAHVAVRGDKLLLARGDREVRNERDARVSIHHSAAVSFLFDAAGLREYSPASVVDPAVAEFRGRVTAELDESLPSGAATVIVETRDRRRLATTVVHARGSTALPLSDLEIEAKLRYLAGYAGSTVAADEVIGRTWGLDDAGDVHALMRAATPASCP